MYRIVWTTLSFALFFVLVLLVESSRAAGSATVTLGAAGGLAKPGDTVTYRLTLNNAAAVSAGVSLAHTLPDSFTYRAGSTLVQINGQIVSQPEPVVQGRKLSWPIFDLPSATYVSQSQFGIHTFVQDLCLESYINFQLDKALALVGEGGYVKQMFYSLKSNMSAPKDCWIQFVNGVYDRRMVPVIRLQGQYDGSKGYWLKPEADAQGSYDYVAQAYRRVVQGLPRRAGQPLYIEVWNEPELAVSWANAPSAVEYGRFFVAVAAAIHSIGDPRIKVLNGALTPGNASFAAELMRAPGFAEAFDGWAAHCYPYNHPPQYNIHQGTAKYQEFAIDSYLLELDVLARYGRSNVQVILTEAGHGLGDRIFSFEGYPAIDETNRADYISRAFRDYWTVWPEVLAVCPFELVGPYGDWGWLDWLYPTTDVPHAQYTAVAALPKPALAWQPAEAVVTFSAQVASIPGDYYSDVQAVVNGQSTIEMKHTAVVQVRDGAGLTYLPGLVKAARPDVSPGSVASKPTDRALQAEKGGAKPYRIMPPLGQEKDVPERALVAHELLLPGVPLSLAIDDTEEYAYVALQGRKLAVVNLSSRAVEKFVELPGEADVMAFNPRVGCLYAIDTREGVLWVIDLVQDKVSLQVNIQAGPVGIAVNALRQRIYVACAGDHSVVVLDEAMNVVRRRPVSEQPLLGIVEHERSGRLYVVTPVAPGRHGIVVLDEETLERIDFLGGSYEYDLSGLYGLAVDAAGGELAGFDRARLLWLDVNAATLRVAGVLPGRILQGNPVFAPRGKKLYVLDAARSALLGIDLR